MPEVWGKVCLWELTGCWLAGPTYPASLARGGCRPRGLAGAWASGDATRAIQGCATHQGSRWNVGHWDSCTRPGQRLGQAARLWFGNHDRYLCWLLSGPGGGARPAALSGTELRGGSRGVPGCAWVQEVWHWRKRRPNHQRLEDAGNF